jgi:hypothetical protein
VKVFTVPPGPAWIAGIALLVPVASLLYLLLAFSGRLTLLSEKELVAAWTESEPAQRRPLFYLNHLPGSATFYSRGQARMLTGDDRELPADGIWLAVHRTLGDASAWDCTLHFEPDTGIFDLYLCRE